MNNVAKVFNMTGADSAGAAQSAVNAHNLASDAHEKKFAGKQDRIESLPEKNVLADADTLPLTDSEEQNAGKRISWANIKAMLGKLYVPMTRRINNRALSADVTLTGDDIKTSATDETSISAALSNKVTVNNGTAYDLDTATNPGGYTWYDSQNLMGAGTGALFDLHVLALPYMSAGQSIVQELTCTYPTTSDTYILPPIRVDYMGSPGNRHSAAKICSPTGRWLGAGERRRILAYARGACDNYISHCSLRRCRN